MILNVKVVTSTVAVESSNETDHSSDQAGITTGEQHRFNERQEHFLEFSGGADSGDIYFSFNFFLLKTKRGTRCTSRYILYILLQASANCDKAFMLQEPLCICSQV